MGTADPKCLLHPSAENSQPAGGAEGGAFLLFLWPAGQDSTLMGVNEDRMKEAECVKLQQLSRHCCSSWYQGGNFWQSSSPAAGGDNLSNDKS